MEAGEKLVPVEIVQAEKDKIEKLLQDGGIKATGEAIAAMQGLAIGELKRIGVNRAQFLEWAAHVWDSTRIVPNQSNDDAEEPGPSIH